MRRYLMARAWLVLSIFFVMVFSTGCVTVKKIVRERVDQDVSGNQGFLTGRPDEISKPKKPDREYIDIRVEMPTWGEVTAPAERYEDPDKQTKAGLRAEPEIAENNIVIKKEMPSAKSVETVYEYDEYEVDMIDSDGDVIVYKEASLKPIEQEYAVKEQIYVVKEGETLSHIAKAFYNKASKWTVIYEANADKIKDPGKVRAGTKLRIPPLNETESEYIK
jgi:LysM repeat protein